MSAYGMTLTVLCTGLAEAVLKDEAPEVGGFDLSAGLFGPNVSAWLRDVAQELRAAEVYRAERDQARSRVDNAVRLLTGIHSLLYPAPMTLLDGRTVVFRPKSPDPHAVLQALSDRIRALPDELERLRAQSEPQVPGTLPLFPGA